MNEQPQDSTWRTEDTEPLAPCSQLCLMLRDSRVNGLLRQQLRPRHKLFFCATGNNEAGSRDADKVDGMADKNAKQLGSIITFMCMHYYA